jgi:hypothetical protein
LRPTRVKDGAWIAVLALVLTFVAASAWQRALDPIIDTGRDLYIPEQIRAGAKLYRDILYYYPPLAAYALAAITAVTGSSLAAYAAIGTTIAALTAAALFVALRMVASAHAAGSAALLFVTCSVFSISGRTSNYLFPYAHAATLAMLFFVSGGAFLIAYAHRRRHPGLMTAALVCLLLASWAKIEFAVFSAALLILFAVVHRIHVAWLGGCVAAGALTFLLVDRYFSDAVPERHWLFENVLASALLKGEPARLFYRQVAGFDALLANVTATFVGALLIGLCVMLLRWAARRDATGVYVACGVILAAVAVFGGAAFFRGWAVVQLVLVPFALRRPREPLLLFLAMSLCASSRILLRLFPSWYGFVFVVPLYALIAYVLFEWLPDRGVYSRRASLLWLVLVVAIGAQFLFVEQRLLATKTFAVRTPRGTFFDSNPDRAAAVGELIEYLHTANAKALVVAPEGLALNYLSGVNTPIAFHTFTPAETADPEIEQRIVDELAAAKPERIAIMTRNVSDFGFRGFGVDYNQRVAALIRERYAPERAWKGAAFELLLLRRR